MKFLLYITPIHRKGRRIIDSRLNLYEQQASVNPNMPLRDLYYVTEELKRIAPPGGLHRRAKVEIPAPKFIVFYNGAEKQPESQTTRSLRNPAVVRWKK